MIGSLEELNFLLVFLVVNLALLSCAFLDLFALGLEIVHLALELTSLALELLDLPTNETNLLNGFALKRMCFKRRALMANLLLHLGFALLRLQCLPHAEGHAALVQCLVRCNRHSNLVSYTQQQKTAFRTIDCHLAN